VDIATVATSILAAVVYAASMYLKKNLSDNPQSFDPLKFLSTVIVGAIVGIVMCQSGTQVTEQDFETQLATYAGLVAVVENVLKILYRYFKR